MTKTDLVFYLSLIAQVGTLFVKLSTSLISTTVAAWITVICALIAFIAFAFYEKFNGTTPPPQPPPAV